MVRILSFCVILFANCFAISSLDLARNIVANPSLDADLQRLFE